MILSILSLVLGGVFKLVPGLAGKYFDHLEKKADTETERIRIAQVAQTQLTSMQAQTIQVAMGFRIFWVAWGMIAIPFAAWLGWGFMDSLFNGSLPDVAKLPPQLKDYGDIVISNIFVSGGVVAAGQAAARTIGNAVANRGVAPVVVPEGGTVVTVDGRTVQTPVKNWRLPKGK